MLYTHLCQHGKNYLQEKSLNLLNHACCSVIPVLYDSKIVQGAQVTTRAVKYNVLRQHSKVLLTWYRNIPQLKVLNNSE